MSCSSRNQSEGKHGKIFLKCSLALFRSSYSSGCFVAQLLVRFRRVIGELSVPGDAPVVDLVDSQRNHQRDNPPARFTVLSPSVTCKFIFLNEISLDCVLNFMQSYPVDNDSSRLRFPSCIFRAASDRTSSRRQRCKCRF